MTTEDSTMKPLLTGSTQEDRAMKNTDSVISIILAWAFLFFLFFLFGGSPDLWDTILVKRNQYIETTIDNLREGR